MLGRRGGQTRLDSQKSGLHSTRNSATKETDHNREGPTSVRICVLGSGSSGNCTLVATERTRLLVDAGFSFREIKLRLQKIGEDPARLDAILISHEHAD